MKKLSKSLLAVPALMLVSSISHADDVRFNGLVDPLCTLVVNADGTMKSNPTGTVLGSKELGGVAGAVVATSNTPLLSFNAQAPSSFTSAPSGGDTNTSFETEFTAAGLGTITGGTPTPLPIGITALAIDLTATKSSGTFPAGDYVADVTVTCE